MPAIRIKVDAKGIQRFTDFTFDPGPMEMSMEMSIESREVQQNWIDGEGDDPVARWFWTTGVNVGQAEILRDLVTGGVTLELAEDGSLSVVEE
jgi:hypothetical protein